MFNIKYKFNKTITILLTIILAISCNSTCSVSAMETPEAVYTGSDSADTVIKNLDYLDIKGTNGWSNEAIYETGALDIMKGYGNRNFGKANLVSKEQAIAIAYRVAGREADAQKAAEMLDNARKTGQKKTDAVNMWSDGYLQLAANEGLITQQDLKDAFNQDQTTLLPTSFYRNAPAQRQEMAYWIASVLKLQPVYGQQKIFNSYNDWRSADPLKVPYIEAVLQSKIMNGDDNGNFKPTGSVTREQVAQIIKNAEGVILPLMNYTRNIGTVESIESSTDLSGGKNTTKKVFNIRNINGKLHQITVQSSDDPSTPYRDEVGGQKLPTQQKELVVYNYGEIGNSDMLDNGYRIEYITAPDNTVRFVKVNSNIYDTKYVAAQINSIDPNNLLVNVLQFFNLDYPEIDWNNVSFKTDSQVNETYRYSNGVFVLKNDKKSDINSLELGDNVILTVQNGIVQEIKTSDFSKKDKEEGIVNGIVEDNNPYLGYITLYSKEGTGAEPTSQEQLLYTTYNYADQNSIDVLKNHKQAKLEDIQTGDTVFLKIDDDKNVTSISAVDNYDVRYGKVISKSPSTLVMEYDDGEQQILDIDKNVTVTADKKLSSYDNIKDGDRLKLVLHETNKFTKVKEIAIEGDEHFITSIYKGTVSYIDETSNNMVTQGIQMLDKGQWIKTDQKGVKSINMSDECKIYSGDNIIDTGKVNKNLRNSEAYIAVEKDYGGGERAVLVSFRNIDDTETVYDDTVGIVSTGSREFSLNKEFKTLKYSPSTIIVKDGRLVSGNSVAQDDLAYVVSNRSYDNGGYNAGVVQINQRPDVNFVQIYRARIKQINADKDFSVDSFSQLNGMLWKYTNTPKTFNITNNTIILDDKGIVAQRDFVGFGDNSFANRTVYVLADGPNAVLVSTATHGTYNFKGEIFEVTGGTIGEDGTAITQPTGIKVWDAKLYDTTKLTWDDSKDMTLNILKNSVIIKENKIAKPSDLKKGDKVRVIKKDDTEKGDAFIIIVE